MEWGVNPTNEDGENQDDEAYDPNKHDSDLDIDSDELDDEYFVMNEEEKKAYRIKHDRIKQEKKADFKRRENF